MSEPKVTPSGLVVIEEGDLPAPTCIGCGEAEAVMDWSLAGVHVGPLCSRCEWLWMRLTGRTVPEHERQWGWAKFCAERGYDPEADTITESMGQA